jgi:hypothetical protein
VLVAFDEIVNLGRSTVFPNWRAINMLFLKAIATTSIDGDIAVSSNTSMVHHIAGVKRDREEAFTTSSSKLDLEEAWKILHTPSLATDAEALEKLLGEYGLDEKEYLPYCEQEDINKIAQLLKLIPRRKFIDLSKRWKASA